MKRRMTALATSVDDSQYPLVTIEREREFTFVLGLRGMRVACDKVLIVTALKVSLVFHSNN